MTQARILLLEGSRRRHDMDGDDYATMYIGHRRDDMRWVSQGKEETDAFMQGQSESSTVFSDT